MATQVRLDADVAEALQRVTDRVGSGSVALHANRKLRQVLGLPPAGGPPPPTPTDNYRARVGSAAGRPIGGSGSSTTKAKADVARRLAR